MPTVGITRLANITGLDFLSIVSYQAIRPNSRGMVVSLGKGPTTIAAKVSAMMESFEGWHAERIEAPIRYESYNEMRRRFNTIDLHLLTQRRPGSPREDLMRMWVEGWDLIQERPIWVPLSRVLVSFTQPIDEIFSNGSNGLASGNTFTEAIVQALTELIERDAQGLWELLPDDEDGRLSRLDLATVTDAECRRLIASIEGAGRVVAVYDQTSDLGIATFCAMIADRPGTYRALPLVAGRAAHPDPAVALQRAITEAAHGRVGIIAGARDDVADHLDGAAPEEIEATFALLERTPGTRRFDRPSLAGTTASADLETLVSVLRRGGIISAAVVSLTNDALRIPVVKVVATQLEFDGYAVAANARARALMANAR
jgi:ribosomal protein S12 methylthiotransferase accessory factor